MNESVRVYVETNFLLELALDTEQAEEARALLQLAGNARVSLVVPALCFGEAHAATVARGREFNLAHERARALRREMDRSRRYQSAVASADAFLEELRDWQRTQLGALQTAFRSVAKAAFCPGLDDDAVARADELAIEHDLELADAMVPAVVVSDLARRPAVSAAFVSTDTSFGQPPTKAILASAGCRFMARFDQAVEFVERPAA